MDIFLEKFPLISLHLPLGLMPSMKKVKSASGSLPALQPLYAPLVQSGSLAGHFEKASEVLTKLLPEEFFTLSAEKQGEWLVSNLPQISWSEPEAFPDVLSVYFLCSPTHEVRAEKVFPDLIRKWAMPEKEVQILSFQNNYFHMREISSKLFFAAEVKVLVEEARDCSRIQEHLPLLVGELSMSVSSSHYLEHILDTKALSLDQKSSQIQHYLRKLVSRQPEQVSSEIFQEMSAFFALSRPEFRKSRQPKHLTRVVVSHFLMRKNLMHHLSISPEKRHLDYRFIRSVLHFPFGTKPVLGLSISVGLTEKNESFEETHILAAVQKFIPNALVVKGSYYSHRIDQDPMKSIYLELEKKDGSRFSQMEVSVLRRELKEELKKRIEKLIPSVFMIRNEEEVMRNILLLSQELKYLSDLPQVMINFDKQDQNELRFTVLVVRVLKKHDLPLEEAFSEVEQSFSFHSDRVQNVGYVRKKNPKQANVFHLRIPKDRAILRTDSSVNFYLAREKVVSIISEALGEVRDYNGGMILKQGELFSQLKHAFGGIADKNHELLENFFFALNPIEAQATTPLYSLKTIFKLFLEASDQELPKKESYFLKVIRRKGSSFAVVRTKDRELEGILSEELNHLENFSKLLVRTQIPFQGTLLQGMIYTSDDPLLHKKFQEIVHGAVKKWVKKLANQQELHLSFLDLPPSLDPRLGGDEMTSTLNKMLFEGLMRMSKDNKPAFACAKSVEISSDQKKYTFKLRSTIWSDGARLVAYDFEYAWKKILSPSFYTPFAYFFYPIKNAQEAKEGKKGLDEVGVKAIDDTTLVVELQHPSPEFLELCSHSLYSPIHHKLDELHPNWAQSREETFVCNGPFQIQKAVYNGGYELVRNPKYWDKDSIKLDKITITKNNTSAAVEMFKKQEIDWIGHPMRPWESFEKADEDVFNETKAAGLLWNVFNTQRFPFDSLKMRQAFSYAINRSSLVKRLSGHPRPAHSPIPEIHSQFAKKEALLGNKKLARRLFDEALFEAGLTKDTFPVLTLYFTGGDSRRAVALELVRQWEETLGIPCHLEEYEFHMLFSKLMKGEYQMGMIIWKAWINTPLYTLSVLQQSSDKVNFSNWEHPDFKRLIEEAKSELDPQRRSTLYGEAEEILIQQCPILPLHNEECRFVHKSSLRDMICTDLGNIDFKEVHIVP